MTFYFIDGGGKWFEELPDEITVREVGWYGHLKETGERLPEYRYVRANRPEGDGGRDEA